jgi:hypothetical protein
VQWGDGSFSEVTLDGDAVTLDHVYPALGLYTILVDGEVLNPDFCPLNFDHTITVQIVPAPRIQAVKLLDIDNAPLRFLSTDQHPYFDGSTVVHGTITVTGAPGDRLDFVTFRIGNGPDSWAVFLTDQAEDRLIGRRFGADKKIEITDPIPLFLIPGFVGGDLFGNSQTNALATVKVEGFLEWGDAVERRLNPVPVLVRYQGKNRFGPRNAAVGGDDWVKPTVRQLIGQYPGIDWGDFSNMNGGRFPPHQSHQTGNDADGHFGGYNARDAATARTIIRHLNGPDGDRIQRVFVTYNRPGGPVFPDRPRAERDPFWNAIKNVVLNDGRQARTVIRPLAGHNTHFHWLVSH